MNRRTLLTVLILCGLVIGLVVGQIVHVQAEYGPGQTIMDSQFAGLLGIFRLIGRDIFMGLLKMIIIPLVLSSVIVGVTSVGDFGKLGWLGGKTILYYFATMFIAVTVGLVLVNMLQPGRVGFETSERQQAEQAWQQRDSSTTQQAPQTLGQALLSIVARMVPYNPVKAAVELDTLKVIVFSILLGIAITLIGPRGTPLTDFFSALYHAILTLTMGVLWLAPVGVFCLIVGSVAAIGLEVFAQKIGLYMVTVLGGLGIHAVIVLPLALWVVGRYNPFKFFNDMRLALMTALSTASSSASLPVTMECAIDNANVSRRSAGFVLPLGATINMDGTALYEAVAVVFLAQVYGVEMGLTQLIIVALTATLAAVGAAGIPEAGLVTMLIVVTAVNNSVPGVKIPVEAVGLILGVDRILDMCRTTVNVWGDAVGARIISRSEPDPA